MEKIVDTKNESLNFQCEQFFGKNWKYIAIFISLAIIVFCYELTKISNKMEEITKIVYENNSKVVLTTSDGRAIKVIKEPLKAEYLKQFAISVYINNFIISRSQLTRDFEVPNFKDYNEVFNNVPSLKNILLNYIDSKETKDTPINKQAIGDLRAYIQWLISAVAQDKLPEYIALKDYSIDRYDYQGNKFTIEISIKTVSQSYILANNKWINQNGIFKIQSTGSFNLNKSSDTNPYGMRIERLKISPIIKGSENL